jgi:hypothetical protein
MRPVPGVSLSLALAFHPFSGRLCRACSKHQAASLFLLGSLSRFMHPSLLSHQSVCGYPPCLSDFTAQLPHLRAYREGLDEPVPEDCNNLVFCPGFPAVSLRRRPFDFFCGTLCHLLLRRTGVPHLPRSGRGSPLAGIHSRLPGRAYWLAHICCRRNHVPPRLTEFAQLFVRSDIFLSRVRSSSTFKVAS